MSAGLRSARSGLTGVVGYALSMGFLAATSLALIPSLIHAGGAAGWGAIALGQAVGAIGAVVVGYGWGLSGPAQVSRTAPAERRVAFQEALSVKATLLLPAMIIAGIIALLLSPGDKLLAVVGAVSAVSVGLSANWYFVGIRRPYMLLALETTPRVIGSAAGVLALELGSSAFAGVLLQMSGVLGACTASAAWILATTRRDNIKHRQSVRALLASQRHGTISMLTSAIYVSAPMIIVAALAPAAQPLYALADKVQRQASVALNPVVSALQGSVPAEQAARLHKNARRALIVGALGSALCGGAVLGAGHWVVRWLGNGTVVAPISVITLMSAFVAINLYESIVAKAVLASLNRLSIIAKATMGSTLVGLVLAAFGALEYGAVGALVGVVGGLLLRLTIELIAAATTLRTLSTDDPGAIGGATIPTTEELHA